MNRSIHLAALVLLAALTSLTGCSQKAAEPPKSSNPPAAAATEDEHPEAAGEHGEEAESPLSMTAAEQAVGRSARRVAGADAARRGVAGTR